MYRFDSSLIKRIIVIFVVLGPCFNLVTGLAAYNRVLTDSFGHGKQLSTVFCIGTSSLALFVVALLFLKYVESRISNPMGDISEAAPNFVGEKGHTMCGAETMEEYGKYTGCDSEVGVLTRSLTGMTRDIEAYVENICNMSNREQMYLAEMFVATTI